MENHRIELIRDSFVHVLFETDEAATIFYGRLFELAPETRALFHEDLAVQGRRLIDTLAAIVTGLSRLEPMLPEIRLMAIRHAGYGVEDRHYPIVGDALLYMVERMAGAKFTPEIGEAWREAYTALADIMIAAARGNEPLRRAAGRA